MHAIEGIYAEVLRQRDLLAAAVTRSYARRERYRQRRERPQAHVLERLGREDMGLCQAVLAGRWTIEDAADEHRIRPRMLQPPAGACRPLVARLVQFLRPRYEQSRLQQLYSAALRQIGASPWRDAIKAALDNLLAAHDALITAALDAEVAGHRDLAPGVWEAHCCAASELMLYLLAASAEPDADNTPNAAPRPGRAEDNTPGDDLAVDMQELPEEEIGKPCGRRDHLWLRWSNAGLGPAKIRNRWNSMTDDERREVAPKASGKLGANGADSVKKAIARLRLAMEQEVD